MMKPRKQRGINWFALIMLAIIVYFSSILISQQVYLSQAADDYAALKEEARQLNELSYIEKVAREELGMTRAGELPYSVGHK